MRNCEDQAGGSTEPAGLLSKRSVISNQPGSIVVPGVKLSHKMILSMLLL